MFLFFNQLAGPPSLETGTVAHETASNATFSLRCREVVVALFGSGHACPSPIHVAPDEIVHFHRWADGTELPHGAMDKVDEALTSLSAVLRFHDRLDWIETRQLISDAIARLQMFVLGQEPAQVDLDE